MSGHKASLTSERGHFTAYLCDTMCAYMATSVGKQGCGNVHVLCLEEA